MTCAFRRGNMGMERRRRRGRTTWPRRTEPPRRLRRQQRRGPQAESSWSAWSRYDRAQQGKAATLHRFKPLHRIQLLHPSYVSPAFRIMRTTVPDFVGNDRSYECRPVACSTSTRKRRPRPPRRSPGWAVTTTSTACLSVGGFGVRWRRLPARPLQALGGCDVLCSNVGVSSSSSAIDRLTEQDWWWQWTPNVLGTVRGVHGFLQLIRAWSEAQPQRLHHVVEHAVRRRCGWARTRLTGSTVIGFAESLRRSSGPKAPA